MTKKIRLFSFLVLFLVTFYFFICSLSIFKLSFKLMTSKLSTNLLEYEHMDNPILGLMIGVICTAIVQVGYFVKSIYI